MGVQTVESRVQRRRADDPVEELAEAVHTLGLGHTHGRLRLAFLVGSLVHS